MTDRPEWLPSLMLLADYGGNRDQYIEALYQQFSDDFVHSSLRFRGRRFGLKRHPMSQGKEATFWHLISEGDDEATRQFDTNRCERIKWPRPIIENADTSPVLVWENQRGHEKRICLWLPDQEYLVILADRKGYLLLWTAYSVTRPQRKRKLLKEYDHWTRKQTENS